LGGFATRVDNAKVWLEIRLELLLEIRGSD
jgi:hypothetical protein